MGKPCQISAYSNEYIPSLKRITDAIHDGGEKAILQIQHGGRQIGRNLVPNGNEGKEVYLDSLPSFLT